MLLPLESWRRIARTFALLCLVGLGCEHRAGPMPSLLAPPPGATSRPAREAYSAGPHAKSSGARGAVLVGRLPLVDEGEWIDARVDLVRAEGAPSPPGGEGDDRVTAWCQSDGLFTIHNALPEVPAALVWARCIEREGAQEVRFGALVLRPGLRGRVDVRLDEPLEGDSLFGLAPAAAEPEDPLGPPASVWVRVLDLDRPDGVDVDLELQAVPGLPVRVVGFRGRRASVRISGRTSTSGRGS